MRKWAAERLTPADLLCNRVRCHVLGDHAQALYFDDIHLSLDGAKLVADRLTQMLAR